MPLLRALAVFVASWIALAALSGPKLWRPSANNHYVHMAQAWLQGRLDHGGPPPGYCTAELRRSGACRQHTFDDWAVVWSLQLADGRTVRGYPCVTQSCRDVLREERVETWWVIGRGWTKVPAREITARSDTWYVTFPPGPAVIMLPWVALFGVRVLDVLVGVTLAALAGAVLVLLLDRVRGLADGRAVANLLFACAWVLGSPACELAAHGEVWFLAQLTAALALLLYLDAVERGRPAAAGLWLGLAVASRPTVVFAGLVFVLRWWRPRSARTMALFCAPLLVIGFVLAAHNVARFEDPLEFGHRFLDIRWQARMQEWGMFSWRYLARNLQCLFTLTPQLQGEFPFLRVSVHGMALWLSTPWLLLAFACVRPMVAPARALWIAAAAVAAMPLFYHNSGQLQFSYRFALDWLPLVVLAMAHHDVHRRRAFMPLVLVACVLHVAAAYTFVRRPQELFVLAPMGWPFEAEFETR